MPAGELLGLPAAGDKGEPRSPIYARAAVLSDDAGRPTLSAEILTDAYRAYKRGDEPTDLILVAEDASVALLIGLPPGLTLAGVVAEKGADAALHPRVPVISGCAGALTLIGDGELVILDPESGRVLVEPAPEEFARLQEERERRPRLFVGGAHLPAMTQSGRTVEVWACVRNESGVHAAIAAGADGILLDRPDATLLPEDDFGVIDPAPLLRIAESLGGGSLAIRADPADIDPGVLFLAAARCRLSWVLDPHLLEQTPAAFRAELQGHVSEEEDPFGDAILREPGSKVKEHAAAFSLAALLKPGCLPAEVPIGFDAIVLPAEDGFAAWTVVDTFALPPLRVLLKSELEGLAEAVFIGAVGVIVPPEQIAAAKDFIRAQEY